MKDQPEVIQDDREWWRNLNGRQKELIVEFVNRCKRNNFAIFDVFKVKEWQHKKEIRENDLVNELEQRNKDLSALCVMCPWQNSKLTAERVNELELQVAELREENRRLGGGH